MCLLCMGNLIFCMIFVFDCKHQAASETLKNEDKLICLMLLRFPLSKGGFEVGEYRLQWSDLALWQKIKRNSFSMFNSVWTMTNPCNVPGLWSPSLALWSLTGDRNEHVTGFGAWCTSTSAKTCQSKIFFIVISLYVFLLNQFFGVAALQKLKPLIHCMLLTYLASRRGWLSEFKQLRESFTKKKPGCQSEDCVPVWQTVACRVF